MRERADYDYRGLGQVLRPKLEQHAGGWRGAAEEIGVTSSDLSRLMAGQAVAAHKVIAVCDWLKQSFRAFYKPPRDRPPRRGDQAVFHGKSTETGGGRR